MSDSKSVQVAASLHQRLLGKVESVARADGRSVSGIIELAVAEFISKPENVLKWRTSAPALPEK
jgi:hypothetical protein